MWSEMKMRYLALVVLVLALIALPASAFTSNNLLITVKQNGDANVDFNYQLSWAEKWATGWIPNKAGFVQFALQNAFPTKKVNSVHVSQTSTDLTVKDFAATSTVPGPWGRKITTYSTPKVKFTAGGKLLEDNKAIVPAISAITPDYSPQRTIVAVPRWLPGNLL